MKIEELNESTGLIMSELAELLPLLGNSVEFKEKELRTLLASDNSHLLLMRTDDGTVVGMLIVSTYFTLAGGMKAWIDDVVVDSACRGRGYGRQLVVYAIDFARGLGARSVSLTSAPKREIANNLYRAVGFEVRDTNVYVYKL